MKSSFACACVLIGFATAGSLFAGPEPIASSGKNAVIEQRAMTTECTWTGFYFGGHAGYGWSDNSTSGDDTGAFDEGPLTIENDADGFVGGGQLGFNWQIHCFVLGLEGSGGYLNLNDRVDPTSTLSPNDNFSHLNMEWYATITPRIGFAWNRLLIYAKGGVDFVGVINDAGDFDISGVDALDHTRNDDTQVSWTVGGGLEYCINPHWSVKVEYDFLDVDDSSSGNIDGNTFHHDHDGIHLVTGGINFRFGSF
jgi:outer membrane immunogenic protein